MHHHARAGLPELAHDATFAVAGQDWTADIDALAVRSGGGKFVREILP
jgi:hypothetical protein